WLTQDIEPPSTEPYARWCERTSSQLMAILLLDYPILSYCIAVAIFYAQTVLMALKDASVVHTMQ
ncbi:hypothetical protein EFT16_05000, partial [Staphylococcus pseudintermedius]|nr:hypothetical protein [Staphylococcus pseudintermedius]MBM0326497.1 hypothetical protein [Staphylococcus pseudintermedius]